MTTILDLRRRGGLLLALLFGLWGCAPSPVTPARPTDAAPSDAAADIARDISASDATGVPCGDGGVCGGGQRCDLARMRCVDCLVTEHCGGATPVCAGGRCVASTPCTSSRMCPAQVCDLARMRCVDCVADLDCDPMLRCVSNVCAATVACRSSRECSAGGLVCDAAAMRCVECVEDRDCPMGQRCNAGRACVATACTPGVATCASNLRVRDCDAMGTATERDCAVGELCVMGACRALLCSPGAVSCESATARRTCNADGMAYTVAACAAGEMCVGGECRAPGCVPGAMSCASVSERRVCNADGRTFTTTACPAGQTCSGGRCAASSDCPAGQTRCGATCVALSRDAANCGRCGNACPSGAACDAGMCAVATASMIDARGGHALVALPDGRVLAIGGVRSDGMNAMREVERYDPTTNRWEARAPLPVAADPANAVVLADGRVVVGGQRTRVLQVYTPATDSWAQLTTTPESLVVVYAQAGRIHAFDAYGVRAYDLATNRWGASTLIEGTQAQHRLCTADPMGGIHVFALTDATRRAVYSTASNSWTLHPGHGFGRSGETVVFGTDGIAYGFGEIGGPPWRAINRVRRIDLTTGMSMMLAPMREARSQPSAVALPGGRFMVAGGLRLIDGTTYEFLSSAEIYTVATNTWR